MGKVTVPHREPEYYQNEGAYYEELSIQEECDKPKQESERSSHDLRPK